MSKKKKPKMEYRYYEVPEGCPVLALLGEKWKQNYGRDIDYLHFHNHLEIGYCYDGDGILTLEDKDLPYKGKMFTVIPRNFPHTTNSNGQQVCAWEYLFIDADGYLERLYRDNPHMAERIMRRVNQSALLAKEEDYRQLASLIHQIIETMRERKEFYREEVKGLTLALLMEIARCGQDENGEQPDKGCDGNSTVISMALDYISKHYSHQIRIEELAQISHISETHFRRVFSECMHMSPVEYINWVRIKTACDDLRKTNDSVGAIAERAGFATLSTFNRNFRRIMGISPQQWRKNPDHYEQKLLNYDIKTQEGW